MQDTMTPIERSKAIEDGEPIDRLPIILFHGTVGAKVAGMTYHESNSTAENIAKKEILTYQKYGFDDVAVSNGLTNLGRALGSNFKVANDSAPTITDYILDDIKNVAELDFDKALYEQDINLQKHYKALQLIQDDIGDEVNSTYDITGPWTAAASIIDPEKLLRATRKNKEKVHELLHYTTQTTIAIIDYFSQITDLRFSITDPFASGDLLGPRQYKEFCLPYTKQVVEHIHSLDKTVYIHICGDTTKVLPLIGDTGVDAISLDQKVDLKEAKEIIGHKTALIGNVDPVKYFYHGNKAEMEEAVKECFDDAVDTPKGFFISAGCSVPYDTPLENIEAFMEASKKYGRMDNTTLSIN